MRRMIPATREAIERYSIPEPNTGCWLWTERVNAQGYGRLGRGRAHRVSYAVFNGPIPDGYDICHRCDQPGCVNPAHLFAGTRRENMRDCSQKERFAIQRSAEACARDTLSLAAVELSRAGAYRGRRELRKDAASFRVLAEQRKHELLKYVGRE